MCIASALALQLRVRLDHQLALTESHLKLAAELRRPVSMHCVRAYGEAMTGWAWNESLGKKLHKIHKELQTLMLAIDNRIISLESICII